MYIVCNGCGVMVEVIENGVDSFGSPYSIAVSKNGRFFINWIDPFFGGESVWDYFGRSVEKVINWKNKYL